MGAITEAHGSVAYSLDTGWIRGCQQSVNEIGNRRGDRSKALPVSCSDWPLASTVGRKLLGSKGRVSGGSIRCVREATTSMRSVHTSKRSNKDKYVKLWLELFTDPSQWWDHRSGKSNSRFPDFKHKLTGEALWLTDARTPPWVASEIESIAPEKLQMHVSSWHLRLSRLNKSRQYQKSIDLFKQMQLEGITANHYAFVHVLNACAALHCLEEGRRTHRRIIEAGFELNLHVSSSLIDMYNKCGSIGDAWNVFNKLSTTDVVVWTAMIMGCAKHGQGLKALELFQQMQREGVEPDRFTFVAVLNACARIPDLQKGILFHEQIKRRGFEAEAYVGSSLVNMYAKCGSIEDAETVFEKMTTHKVVSYNCMIVGYARCGKGLKALELFQQMQRDGVEPNSITCVGLLNACASLSALQEGRQIHEQIIRNNFESDMFVGNSLVDMYAKCGSIEDAQRVFEKMPSRNAISWNCMIVGLARCGQGLKALEMFKQMQLDRIDPDSFTFVGLLNACAGIAALEEGKFVHEQIIQSGLESDVYVGSSLVDMYAKCGSVKDAWRVFHRMPARTEVAWNGMILACVKCGAGLEALELFQEMQREGINPDPCTFIGALNACAGIAALEEGRRVHEQIIRSGCESDKYVSNSLVDMYAKCGSIQDARRVFDNMNKWDVADWNVMIMGYAMHGNAKEAVSLFEEMFRASADINEATFISLLSACSHGGLVTEGLKYFKSMGPVYGVLPAVEHYTCMVDMLGRAGLLDDAEQMVKTMPLEPCPSVWMSLLGACRIHGNLAMGERASNKLLELDPKNTAGYVLLSNIYGAAGQWDCKTSAEEQRLGSCAVKQPSRTWIEVNNEVHSFVVNDCEHPQILQIREELVRLSKHMQKAGYVPDIKFALHDVEEENRVAYLSAHSENLAIAFGLISTPAGAPLCIVQNLRVCADCHAATKLIAKIVGRTITIGDANRFHHFEDGVCSCGDYW